MFLTTTLVNTGLALQRKTIMSVDHNDIFATALMLVAYAPTSTNIESSLRSAASRAYYAALHASLDALPPQFCPATQQLKEENSHVLIQTAVTRWGHSLTPGRTEAQEVARHLPKLKKIRKNATMHYSRIFHPMTPTRPCAGHVPCSKKLGAQNPGSLNNPISASSAAWSRLMGRRWFPLAA